MVIAIILLTISTVPKTLQEDTYYMIKVGEYITHSAIYGKNITKYTGNNAA